MIKCYIETFARWRYPLLAIILTLITITAGGARYLEFSADYRVYFSADNPQLRAFEELQNTYTKTDNVLFVVAPKNGGVFDPKTLTAVEELTEAAWQIPYSIRVDSVTNFQHSYGQGDELVVEDLVSGAAGLPVAELQRIEAIAVAEPALRNRLISPDGRFTGVNVTIQLAGIDPVREVPEVVAHARKLVQDLREGYPHLDVHLTGIVVMNNAFSEASEKDILTLIPVMFVVVMVVLTLMLRSMTATLATVAVIAATVATTMGVAGWLGIRLTPPTMSAPTIILTIVVANCVHVLVSFLFYTRQGFVKTAALLESLRINWQPVLITGSTTAIGFLSMNFSDSPPFRDLGNIVALGVMFAVAFTAVLLPLLLLLLPLGPNQTGVRGSAAMDRLADFVIRQRNRLFWGTGVLMLVLFAFLPRNELNDEFVKYFDDTVDFRQATDFTVANLTGIDIIEYSLGAAEPGGVSNPEFLQTLDTFARWYRQQPEVLHVNTLSDTLKRLNKNLHGEDPAWYRLPDRREQAAQYLLLYELSLPYGLDLNDQVNLDKSATRFTVTLKTLSSRELIDLEERAQAWLEVNAPTSMQVPGASSSIMFAHIGQRNITSMITGTSVALVVISLLLVVALRSVKIGLVSLLPNLFPAAMAFGLWGLLVGQVGLALSVVVAMSLGIVVDDTVHFLSKFLRARRENQMDVEEAVRHAFNNVGVAMWVTSVVLICGFLVLSLSSFEVNAGMGLLTALTISLALAADYLFLPPLLMKLKFKEKLYEEANTTPAVNNSTSAV